MLRRLGSEISIWLFAFGYFACYVPYSALTKLLSDGLLPGMREGVPGLALLPIVNIVSLLGMIAFLSALGWWQYAGHVRIGSLRIPMPGRWTFLSGVCTAAIIATTTLAYTFSGVSIVFMMLLMRGGVLGIAPVVDFVSKREVPWPSRIALLLSMAAVLVPFLGRTQSSLAMSWIAAANVALYLLAYFARLRFMTRLAKSDDQNAQKRFFVEEQMTATPLVVVSLIVLALVGQGPLADIREGFVSLPFSAWLLPTAVVGLMSQGTGVFGGLVLLDKRENSFCVPVNRAGSVLAGILATWILARWFGVETSGGLDLVGAGLLVLAVIALGMPRPGSRPVTITSK